MTGMNPELKKKIQILLGLAIAISGIRAGYIVCARHSEKTEGAAKQAPPLNPDYYVIPKKLYPYDLKSAQQLTEQPVWVKEGYRYTYYPYDTARHHTDFSHEAGLLLPIEKLEIKNVIADLAPGNQHVVMAVFAKEAKTYALQVGVVQGNGYEIYSDEIFFIQDPHELYRHWPAEVWDAIGKHEVKPGMNEFQVDFAVGMGIPERSSNPAVKTVNYPNGGHPVRVTFEDGKAAAIRKDAGG
jgi:hypothetical protein